jgi:hypothetical protein
MINSCILHTNLLIMALSYKNIRDERTWKATTGLSSAKFHELVEHFKNVYEDFLGESIEKRQENAKDEATFSTYADLLFFLLYSIKTGSTYDVLAFNFGMDRANAFRNQSFGMSILRMTLAETEDLPKRMYESAVEFQRDMEKHQTLLLDATEQRRQRAGNQDDQKEDYSGKKKRTR